MAYLSQFRDTNEQLFGFEGQKYVYPCQYSKEQIKGEFKIQNNLAMSQYDQTLENDSFEDAQECQEVKKRITLTSSQLIELTYNEEKFNKKLEEFNKNACLLIEDQRYRQAGIYLDEAEKILQYSAGCGKTIERSLITTILNNQACLLQRTSNFQQSSNYIEAIIFNINDFLEGFSQAVLSSAIIDPVTHEFAEFSTILERKISLTLYHLRFCALTSYQKNNQLALKSARKALKLLKEICIQQHSYQTYLEKEQGSSMENGEYIKIQQDKKFKFIFKELSKIRDIEDTFSDNFQVHLTKTLSYVKEFQKNIENHGLTQLQGIFESYSIANLVEAPLLQINLKPLHKQFIEKQFSTVGKIFRVIHTSMAYFTVATQLRLISAAKYSLDEEERKSSPQFKESKLYHLYSINILTRFLPFRTVFYDHSVYSFKNHYGINLQQLALSHYDNINLKTNSIIKSQTHQSSSKSSHSQQNKTIQIHQSKDSGDLDHQNIVRASIQSQRQLDLMAQIQNRNAQVKKLKGVKSKGKIPKLTTSESIKGLPTERLSALNGNQSKNKQNKSKNKLIISKAKQTIKSRTKITKHQDDDDQQRRGIYYGFTNKSRSKSKKQIGIQRRSSKKGLQTIKSGLVFQSKRIKQQAKVDEQYGVKSLGVFGSKNHTIVSKVKKSRGLRTSQTNQQQGPYLIKFNKTSGIQPANMKKLKSPRNNKKKQTSKRKNVSKDKYYI